MEGLKTQRVAANFLCGVEEGFVLDALSVLLKGEFVCHIGVKAGKVSVISS